MVFDRKARKKELYEKLQMNNSSPTMETLAAIESQLSQEEAQEKQEQTQIAEIVKQSFQEFHVETSPRYDPVISEIYRQIELEMDLRFKDFYKNMASRMRENLRTEWEAEKFTQSKLLQLLDKEIQNDDTFIPRVRILIENALSNNREYARRGK